MKDYFRAAGLPMPHYRDQDRNKVRMTVWHGTWDIDNYFNWNDHREEIQEEYDVKIDGGGSYQNCYVQFDTMNDAALFKLKWSHLIRIEHMVTIKVEMPSYLTAFKRHEEVKDAGYLVIWDYFVKKWIVEFDNEADAAVFKLKYL